MCDVAAAAFVCCCPVRVCFFGCIVKFRNGFARNNPVRHFCNSIPEFSAQILELHWGVSSSLFLLCFPVSFLESSFFSESGVDESSRLSHKHTNQKHTQHTTRKRGFMLATRAAPLSLCFHVSHCFNVLQAWGPQALGCTNSDTTTINPAARGCWADV